MSPLDTAAESLKCLIVEDEFHSYELLKTIMEEYLPHIQIMGHTTSIKSTLEFLDDENVDIIFMDIQLQDGLSFEIMNALKEWDFSLIFTTAFNQYAIDAFGVEAVDYILKPYSPKQVINAVKRVEKKHQMSLKSMEHMLAQISLQTPSQSRVKLSLQDGYTFIERGAILYCEAEGSYCKVVTQDQGVIMCSKTLKTIEAVLNGEEFVRVHSSHLVNYHHVFKYHKAEGGTLVMSNGDLVPISRTAKNELMKLIDKLIRQ
jgi:two-component system LytT family response regulator